MEVKKNWRRGGGVEINYYLCVANGAVNDLSVGSGEKGIW